MLSLGEVLLPKAGLLTKHICPTEERRNYALPVGILYPHKLCALQLLTTNNQIFLPSLLYNCHVTLEVWLLQTSRHAIEAV
jgi:hypothetical protein